jgi:hypothetical protein
MFFFKWLEIWMVENNNICVKFKAQNFIGEFFFWGGAKFCLEMCEQEHTRKTKNTTLLDSWGNGVNLHQGNSMTNDMHSLMGSSCCPYLFGVFCLSQKGRKQQYLWWKMPFGRWKIPFGSWSIVRLFVVREVSVWVSSPQGGHLWVWDELLYINRLS